MRVSADPKPGDWTRVLCPPGVGARLYAFAADIYPICRSITGPGVRETLARVADTQPYRLIETMAERMAAALLGEFATSRVRVLVKKPAALRSAGVDYPAVEIVRERDG